jgi:hypothetical protein
MGQCFSTSARRTRVHSPPQTPGRAAAGSDETTRPGSPALASPEGLSARDTRAARGGSEGSEAFIPPRATLRWPNGEGSEGRLEVSTSGRLHFLADGVNGRPLEDRCEQRPDRSELDPAPIPVSLSPGPADGGPVHVTPTLMRTLPKVDPAVLQMLARTAARTSDAGVSEQAEKAFTKIMAAALRHMEADCTDPAAVRRARASLMRPFSVEMVPSPSGGYFSMVEGGRNEDPGRALMHLEEGEHLFLRVAQQGERDAHALAVSATLLPGGQVRLSIFNSLGWGHMSEGLQLATGLTSRHAAVGKLMSLEDASKALSFLSSHVVDFADRTPTEDAAWRAPGAGLPLWVWLSTFGPDDVELQPTGPQTTPQKSADCGIEVQFAWLASVLPEADYKLAKANVLDALAHSQEERDGLVLQHLKERVTSSLSGYAMAAAT